MIKFSTRQAARQFKSSLIKNKDAKLVDLGAVAIGKRWAVKVI